MLEKENIQYAGFRNTVDEEGNITGFQFRVRTSYYRGVWLSQLRIGSVIVDGETFAPNSGLVTWVIQGKEYTIEEMAQNNEDFWPMTEAAVVKVKKPGGLAQGYHDVKIRFTNSSSYMPPFMDIFKDEDGRGIMGSTTHERRMLIV